MGQAVLSVEEKTTIYAYHRLNGRKTAKRYALPRLPKKAVVESMKKAASWETLFLTLMSFFMGRAVLSGGLIPFPAALMAAVITIVPDTGFWALLALGGGIYTAVSGYNLITTYIVLMLLFIVLAQTDGQFRQKWYGVPMLVTGLSIIVKIAMYAYFQPNLYNFLLALFEGILAGTSSFLLIRALPIFRRRKSLSSFKREEIIGGAVFIVAVLTGMSGIKFEGIEVKNVIARALVIFAAYCGGSGFGAAMGTLAGIVPGVNAVILPGLVAIYSFSGLVSGMFRNFGRIGVCIGFILGNVILSIYLTDYSKLIISLVETGLAVALFLLSPQKKLVAARSVLKNSLHTLNSKSPSENKIREITAGKVREFSRVFKELSNSFKEVSCDLKVSEDNNLQNLFNGITIKVCKGCSLHRICWEKEFYKTYRNVMDMLSYIESNGRITEEHISQDIKKRCTRLRELAITVNCLFETYRNNQAWQRKFAEGREIVGGQLEGLATIMQNLSEEIKIDIRMREDIEVILRTELTRAGYSVLDLSVKGDSGGQFEVTMSCPSCGGKMQCVKEIGPLVSKILSQPLTVINSNYCTKKTGEPVCEFKMLPMRTLKVETGIASVAKHSSMVSGDSYSTFDLKNGKYAIALSDGMGVGTKARTESRAAITLLEKLLETGFDQFTAVKTVNSILVLGSPDETFATIDLAVIDLMKGTTEFVKIGSAPSFIKRGGQVSMVRANSLPIGILNNIEVDVIQHSLGHDDVLVMASDGLLESVDNDIEGETWIMDTLQNIVTTDPQNIADLLLNKAIINSGGLARDDMTVIVTRLSATSQNVFR